MKITVPSFPRSKFAKVITYKTIIERIQNLYYDEKFIDYYATGGDHESFQQIILEDPTYLEIEKAYKEISEFRIVLLKHRKKKEEVILPVPTTANKWLNWYLDNKKEIHYRYGKRIEEDQETEDGGSDQ
jgi:hypothetical protein